MKERKKEITFLPINSVCFPQVSQVPGKRERAVNKQTNPRKLQKEQSW